MNRADRRRLINMNKKKLPTNLGPVDLNAVRRLEEAKKSGFVRQGPAEDHAAHSPPVDAPVTFDLRTQRGHTVLEFERSIKILALNREKTRLVGETLLQAADVLDREHEEETRVKDGASTENEPPSEAPVEPSIETPSGESPNERNE